MIIILEIELDPLSKYVIPFTMLTFEQFLVLQVVNQLSVKYGSDKEEDDENDQLLQDYAEAIVEAYTNNQDLSDEERFMVENAEEDYPRFLHARRS